MLCMTIMMVPFAYFTSMAKLTLSTQLTPSRCPVCQGSGPNSCERDPRVYSQSGCYFAFNVDNKKECPDGWSCDDSIAPHPSLRYHRDAMTMTDFRIGLYALNISVAFEELPPKR